MFERLRLLAGGERTIRGRLLATGQLVSVRIRQGKIHAIEAAVSAEADSSAGTPPPSAEAASLPWIAPGLVDLQVNGHAGINLNAAPYTADKVIRLTQALCKEGVTAYFPTIVTGAPDDIEAAMRAIAAACREDELTGRCVAGIHLEGPFISPEEGPRGAHMQAYIQLPDWSLTARWQEAAAGRIKLLTLSPEWDGAPAFIARCVQEGIAIAIGHTAATSEQIAAAVAAGATMSTHLGNGAHLMLPRHPNYLWEQLANDELWACVIADGFHLPVSFLKVVRKVKRDKLLLVSDAVLYSGMTPGDYLNPSIGPVVLTPEGRLHMKRDARLLAGSAQMLTHGIAHLVNEGVCSLEEAWESASVLPAQAMRLSMKNGIEPGAQADLVVLQWTGGRVKILQTYKCGVPIYECGQEERRL